MTRRSAWALIEILAGQHPAGLTAQERWRLNRKADELAGSDKPEDLLRRWLVLRATRQVLHTREPQGLRDDPAMILSGFSDPRAGLTSAAVEGYVRTTDAPGLIRRHLLQPPAPGTSNVFLHVTEFIPLPPIPAVLVAADLVDHGGPRELARARALVRGNS